MADGLFFHPCQLRRIMATGIRESAAIHIAAPLHTTEVCHLFEANARSAVLSMDSGVKDANGCVASPPPVKNLSSTNSTLCAQPCYCQTVETHSCVSASCQVFAEFTLKRITPCFLPKSSSVTKRAQCHALATSV